jgi:hypothetical protein
MDEETRTGSEAASEARTPVARVRIERRYVLEVVVPAAVVREALSDAAAGEPTDEEAFSLVVGAARKLARIYAVPERRLLDQVTVEWQEPGEDPET